MRICQSLIGKYQDIISTGSTDIRTTDKVQHRIDLSDTTPFKQRYRRIPPSMIEEVRTHVKELPASGVIRPSHSPFSSIGYWSENTSDPCECALTIGGSTQGLFEIIMICQGLMRY